MNQDFIKSQFNEQLIKIVISAPRKRDVRYNKIVVKPFLQAGELQFQFESFTDKQAFHENLDTVSAASRLNSIIHENTYKQINGENAEGNWQILLSKKGKINFKEQKNSVVKSVDLSHNRQKSYILEEGIAVPFLIQLGVMTEEGKVVRKYYDKFKQINRFTEMVADVFPHLPKDRPIKIIDFGCGRSYLTFALYHYLVSVKGMDVEMTGLDLMEQVIRDCNDMAGKCGYTNLQFLHGDIVDYEHTKDVDMVVTLHACDTATDLAMKKAVLWNASVIMSVPCCQHEWNGTIRNDTMKEIFQYGIIKERMAALMTDAMRGNWLKLHGYEVQIMEFIDVAHTPKNLLIRGVKTKDVPEDAIDYSEFDALAGQFNGQLTIRQ